MNTRNIIAATVLGLLGGAALAEGEDRIDYTGQYLTGSRAEVMAETRSFDRMHDDFLSRSNEAYGEVDAAASTWSSSENNAMVRATATASSRNFRADESYGGFPVVDTRYERGE